MSETLRRVRLALVMALLLLLATFAYQNMAEVELTFLIWDFQSRRIVVIAVSLVVGLAIGLLIGLTYVRHR